MAPAEHAKNWLRSKTGIPCNRGGAYFTEYNFRMFVTNNENVGDSIMKAIANTYGPFLGIIANLTHLVYSVAKKFYSNISIYKVRLLEKFQIIISSFMSFIAE